MKSMLKKLIGTALALLLFCATVLPAQAMENGLSEEAAAESSTVEIQDAGTYAATKELRAVWVATVFGLDYPSSTTTDPALLKAEADSILQGTKDMGMNAVFLQVRPSNDALYPSSLYPWSRYLTGTPGKAPSSGFDPLDYWVKKAHALGLELHAWINPFRATKEGKKEFQALSADNPAKQHPEWVVVHEDNYYLDPGLPQVRELVVQGAEEIARNYDVDGVHLDDYFYPGSDFADQKSYAQYGKGFGNVGDWRRDNVNQLVKTLGQRLHAINPGLNYGISPSGVWADKSSLPEGSNTTGGYESYYETYADSRKWVKQGWVDYICPQIYWYIGHPSMDYAAIARWWADTVKGTGVKLYTGMADYQAGNPSPSSPWYGVSAMKKQLDLNAGLPQVSGEVHFRYKLIKENRQLSALYRENYGSSHPYLNTKEHNAYISGSNGAFRPDDTLNRAEAVTLLAQLSVDKNGNPLETSAPYWGPFTDVNGGEWFAKYVSFAERYSVTGGYPDGTFRPYRPVTRAEWVTLLSAYFDGVSGTTASGFPDVASGHWASAKIAYAVKQGWVGGYPDGTFRPDKAITRAEAVRILNSALNRKADRGYLDSHEVSLPFHDVAEKHWAYYEIVEASLAHDYQKVNGTELWK